MFADYNVSDQREFSSFDCLWYLCPNALSLMWRLHEGINSLVDVPLRITNTQTRNMRSLKCELQKNLLGLDTSQKTGNFRCLWIWWLIWNFSEKRKNSTYLGILNNTRSNWSMGEIFCLRSYLSYVHIPQKISLKLLHAQAILR